jgi:hypothetical protein
MEVELDAWQQEVIDCEERYICLCKGRQIGGTFTFARKAALRLLKQPNARIIVLSLTEDQAQTVIVMVLDYLLSHHKSKICTGMKRPTKSTIQLTNGSIIRSRPTGDTGDGARGFTGDVLYLNECSRMNELVFEAAKPILLTTGGEIWMDSTPFGKYTKDRTKFNYFYKAFLNKNSKWKVFYKSSEEVIHNRPVSKSWTKEIRELAIQFLDEEKNEMSKLQYGQEYLGLFMEDLQQYFSDELIKKVCCLEHPEGIKQNGEHFAGVDIARMGRDLGVIAVGRRINREMIHQVDNIVTRKQLTWETEERIINMDKIYNCSKIYIDAGAGTLGVSVLDHLLRNEQVKRKVVAINNRARPLDNDKFARLLKEDLYDNLKSLMEKGEIKLLNNSEVKTSLKSVQWQHVYKDGQPTKVKIFGSHTHSAEAIIRMAWCIKEKVINRLVYSFKL